MIRAWLLVVIGLGTYLAALAVQAPATLIDAKLMEISNGRLRLAGAEGSVWSGKGRLEFRDAASRLITGKPLAWHLQPQSLLRGRLEYGIEFERGNQYARIAALQSEIEIFDTTIELPAAALTIAESRLAPLKLSGDIELRIPKLSIGSGGAIGNTTLQWRNAGSSYSPVSPLGSYELQIEGAGTTVQTKLHTLEGPIQMEGTGSWSRGRNIAFQMTLQVPPEYREQMTPLLRLISAQRDEGTFELQLR